MGPVAHVIVVTESQTFAERFIYIFPGKDYASKRAGSAWLSRRKGVRRLAEIENRRYAG